MTEFTEYDETEEEFYANLRSDSVWAHYGNLYPEHIPGDAECIYDEQQKLWRLEEEVRQAERAAGWPTP